jgi:hypothetical protein
MPKKGRLYYQLLPKEVKEAIDELIADLKQSVPYIKDLIDEYAEIKSKLAMLYDTDPENINKHKDKAVDEMDKLIANKVLGVVKTILNKERELSNVELQKPEKFIIPNRWFMKS